MLRLRFVLLPLLALLALLAGCAVESPVALQGKPKLAGPRCAASEACPEEPAP